MVLPVPFDRDMSYQDSSSSVDDGELADDDLDEMDDYRDDDDNGSDEDTEEASETDMKESPEIKEMVYQDKLERINFQISQLSSNSHPELLRRFQKIENDYLERNTFNKMSRDYLLERVQHDFVAEKKAAAKEFEEKKIELKDNLIADLEDKKKHVESERHNMELNGDSMEMKPAMTRKLRRRPNDPPPVPDKRRKPITTTLTFTLDDRDIDSDLKMITRARAPTTSQPRKNQAPPKPIPTENKVASPHTEARVEDGKLLYEKRWYHRGQSIFVEGRDHPRFPAHITAIGSDCIWVKKTTPDGNKLRIYTALLARGRITIKRRAP
ncbi:sin3 histone deacetylase corepressor complex component SDS3-like isoform X2 [Arctopsyche grandis]|uniref:sin3 histone deacetylase corepressor complex component SDS3-like isoform X2 n=1 Tax=Arctopsyche grandis TaxID=121162 RepID=UPI00406D7587